MKILITISFIFICQRAFCQTNNYTAYWRVKPNQNIISFTIQRSSDNQNWINAAIVTATKDTSYKADFKAFPNNFIRIVAKESNIAWNSKVIQVTAVLPVVISKFTARKITWRK